MASLLSVNVGMPKDVAWQGKTVHTGIWKAPVDGPRMVRRLNIDGDGQGDLNGHGGEQRAVLVYQIASYEHWQKHFGRDDFTFGQFGENFTVDGLADDEVCVGDRYRIGEAEFEVTQPRVTCYRVGMRLGEPAMPSLLVAHHRPGFYLRVITEGRVQAGDEITRTRVGPGALSVADIDALLYLPDRDLAKLRTALNIPALSPGWQQSFHDIADAADRGDSPDLPSVGVEPGWSGFRRLRVARITPESSSVSSIYLEADDGAPLPRAMPGQYLTLRVTGAGRPAPVRSYSLSSAPGAGTYRVSVKRESHGVVSAYLHTELRPGAVLDVAAPRGDFVLEDDTNPVLLISAGIGVTPVLAMLHELREQRSRRQVWWIHTVRDRARHALAGEAHDLIAALPDAQEHIFYTAPGTAPATAPGDGTEHHGRLDGERLAELGVPADATAYICGPAAFMADIHDALAGIGIAEDRIRTELFGAMPAINPGVTGHARTPPHQPSGAPGTGPAITFARSGLTVPWSEQPSLLDLADACDVPTRWSCRTGVCHTCTTTLLSGGVDYSPPPLEPPGPDDVLICCAQPVTDIVLDL